ncbi:MAG: hypothetical protein RIT27_1334 [Pseudomonadota bacterium]|jgi:hypothetical protein
MTTPIQIISNPSNNHQAKTVQINADTKDMSQLFESLGFNHSNGLINIVNSGREKENHEMNGRLAQLFSRSIATVAAELSASLLDNGVVNEINSLLGKGIADRNHKSSLIGVCSSALLENEEQLEPNHSHFIFVENSVSHGNEIREKVLEHFSQHLPVLTLLVGGDEMTCKQVLHSVRQNWDIVVLTGTGQLADELMKLKNNRPDFIDDPMLAEIISDGKLHFFNTDDGILDKKIVELQRIIRRLMRGDTILQQAWERFAMYDLNANRHQKNYRKIQIAILFLTVSGTGLALIQNSLDYHLEYIDKSKLEKQILETQTLLPETIRKPQEIISKIPSDHNNKNTLAQTFRETLFSWFMVREKLLQGLSGLLKSIIIVIPIMITALLAAANRFNAGTKWLLLRGSAQAVKREIFKYRMRADIYFSNEEQITREERLADKLKDINSALSQTEINTSALQSYQGVLPPPKAVAKNDSGMSGLSPEQYLSFRLEDQYHYYVEKTTQLELKLNKFQWGIYITGGMGTLLAAIGMEVWIALTSALVAAFGTYLEYQQIEKTLLKYNRAALELNNVKTWWIALPSIEQEKQLNIDALVMRTEQILNSEFSDWIQEMQNALTALKEKQQKAPKTTGEEKLEKML